LARRTDYFRWVSNCQNSLGEQLGQGACFSGSVGTSSSPLTLHFLTGPWQWPGSFVPVTLPT
jgi:hypothetical protein